MNISVTGGGKCQNSLDIQNLSIANDLENLSRGKLPSGGVRLKTPGQVRGAGTKSHTPTQSCTSCQSWQGCLFYKRAQRWMVSYPRSHRESKKNQD